jgi:hypothetical protein
MTGDSSRLPGSALLWGLAIFVFIVVVGAPGVLYAILEGRQRVNALTAVIAVEVVLAVAVGLYLRARSR